MPNFAILAWQPLLRPPVSGAEPPVVPGVAIKAVTCRNTVTSISALVTASDPVESARFIISDLVGPGSIQSADIRVRLVGSVSTPEAGAVSDPLLDVEEFSIDKSATIYATITIPKSAVPGTYRGIASLLVGGNTVASNDIELEISAVALADVHNWDFFLNVWMNPAAIARWHAVKLWSDEHFELLRVYIEDLAEHGQKTAVVPICFEPWGSQTRDPYPNTIQWTRNGDNWEFDYTVFDKYVELYEECGIDRGIHCYSIVQGPGESDSSVVEYLDTQTGEHVKIETHIGDKDYTAAWSAFFKSFSAHLCHTGRMHKTYIGFDEKSNEVMKKLLGFMNQYAPDFRTSHATKSPDDLINRLDDLSLAVSFDDSGITEAVPAERAAMGVAELLDPDNVCAISHSCPEKTMTTYYICSVPDYPNTFVHSPLVESRMLGFLAAQGGYDGFLRWAYNDWSDDPMEHPEWGEWPTGDTFLVYPGEHGPISSLRWEQLREGIQDYELARIAAASIRTPDDMVDYSQAIMLACRNVNGKRKSLGDIEIARRLLIPIAERQNR